MKVLFLILSVFLIFPSVVYAQEEVESNNPNLIKMRPIYFAAGNLNLSYERALNNKTSINVEFVYYHNYTFINRGFYDDEDLNGFEIPVSFRFYLTHRMMSAPEGFFVAPRATFITLKEKETEDAYDWSSLGVGGLIGYQWIWKSGISLELATGPMFILNDTDEDIHSGSIQPNLIVRMGYSFE